ncbi:MAG: DUF4091 domain-containing protein [Clostridia bacterium]|nr:DUF4091 domain-containing protein [Clostridia bacterium]MBO7318909.1 DUF4091 domain-containing protein [Clostridia bacterium]
MSSITDIRILSSLEKIYDSDKMPEGAYKGFSMLRNEKKSFQLAVETAEECEIDLAYESTLKDMRIYTVEHIKSDLPMNKKNTDSYYRFSKSGYYPDLLLPFEGKLKAKKGITVLWFEIDGASNDAGRHRVDFTVDGKSVGVDIEIIDAELDFKDFVYTCWFHTDCLMSHYGFEAFSDEYWRVTANFLKTAREYGMNCVLTPIFTPPLDTQKGKERPTVQLIDVTVSGGEYSFNFDKLTQWIDMAHSCGVEYFELAHFYTQWGARHAPKIMATVDGTYKQIFGWKTRANSRKYKAFLTALSVELKKYLEERNLKEKVLIHVSDEPAKSVLRAYKKASDHIHSLYEGYKIVDALSDYSFYEKKIVSNPIPANDHIDKFLGNVENLWVYYCSAQCNHNVANRFFCNDSIRTRIIGYQMFKYDIKGFLQWGYNFYFTKLSKGKINPFEVSDAGKAFPSGDSYIVYPAEDGTPYHSLRLKVFYDALQDMAALNTLEKLADKKVCLDLIEEKGKHNLTFREYPHSDEWLLETREAVNAAIKDKIK